MVMSGLLRFTSFSDEEVSKLTFGHKRLVESERCKGLLFAIFTQCHLGIESIF